MKLYTLLSALIIIACVLVNNCDACSDDDFAAFKTKFNKTYESEEDEKNRRELFCKNMELVKTHNARYDRGEESYFLGINDFSDWTQEEVSKRLGGGIRKRD